MSCNATAGQKLSYLSEVIDRRKHSHTTVGYYCIVTEEERTSQNNKYVKNSVYILKEKQAVQYLEEGKGGLEL